jgi:broad specificity phosphatase PhoE
VIYAIRHFITPWNAKGLLQGRSDISIDISLPTNKALTLAVSAQLADIQFDRVLVSPLKRAIETAQMLGIKSYSISPLIGEMSFGDYEGKPKETMIEDFKGAWETDPMQTSLKTELTELEARIKKFVAEIDSDSNTLIISHGAFIRGLKSYVHFGTIDRMNQSEVRNGDLISIAR